MSIPAADKVAKHIAYLLKSRTEKMGLDYANIWCLKSLTSHARMFQEEDNLI